MADHTPSPAAPRIDDDELLANAIPIEEADDGEDLSIGLEADETNRGAHADGDGHPPKRPTIHKTSERMSIQSEWRRKVNTTGAGACHVKTFVAKFRIEAIEHLDQQINEWLDAHPDYEVKLVTTSVGSWQGKYIEDALVVNVWV